MAFWTIEWRIVFLFYLFCYSSNNKNEEKQIHEAIKTLKDNHIIAAGESPQHNFVDRFASVFNKEVQLWKDHNSVQQLEPEPIKSSISNSQASFWHSGKQTIDLDDDKRESDLLKGCFYGE